MKKILHFTAGLAVGIMSVFVMARLHSVGTDTHPINEREDQT